MVFTGHESLIYFRPIHFMTPEKAVTASLACISWVMKVLMAYEIPVKAQLKTPESVQLTLAQKKTLMP